MTFTVEKIEQARRHVEIVIRSSHLPGWKENREAWDVLNATFLDYAAMKRREAECAPCGEVFGPKSFSTMVALNSPLPPGTLLYTSPPSQPSTGVPDGWQLVPKCLTEAMMDEFQNSKITNAYWNAAVMWEAMLAAAPRSP